MSFTSELGITDSILASQMVAGGLFANVFTESVISTLGITHQVLPLESAEVSNTIAFVHSATFLREPTDPKLPLVLDQGKVQTNFTTIDVAPCSTRFISSNYTSQLSDRVIVCEDGLTVTLIQSKDFAYRWLYIKNISPSSVTIDPDGSEVIDDQTSLTLIQWESVMLFSVGSQWVIL